MFPEGYQDGMNWAKTASNERLANLEDFDGTLCGGPVTPLEQVYYAMYPEHVGQWDKAGQFWSAFNIPQREGDRQEYADNFAAAAKGNTDALDETVYSLAEDFQSSIMNGESMHPIGDYWTRGELLAIFDVIKDLLFKGPSGVELGEQIGVETDHSV